MTPNAPTDYDVNVLLELFPSEQDARKLMTLLVTDLQKRNSELQEAMLIGDHDTARRAAHSIAGVAANACADALCEMGRDLEGFLERGDVQQAQPLAVRVAAEAGAVVEVVQARLGH